MAAELAPRNRSLPGLPNTVYAGPASGTAGAPPTFRTIVAADFSAVSANMIFVGPASGAAAAPTFRAQVYADQALAIPKFDLTTHLYCGGL